MLSQRGAVEAAPPTRECTTAAAGGRDGAACVVRSHTRRPAQTRGLHVATRTLTLKLPAQSHFAVSAGAVLNNPVWDSVTRAAQSLRWPIF